MQFHERRFAIEAFAVPPAGRVDDDRRDPAAKEAAVAPAPSATDVEAQTKTKPVPAGGERAQDPAIAAPSSTAPLAAPAAAAPPLPASKSKSKASPKASREVSARASPSKLPPRASRLHQIASDTLQQDPEALEERSASVAVDEEADEEVGGHEDEEIADGDGTEEEAEEAPPARARALARALARVQKKKTKDTKKKKKPAAGRAAGQAGTEAMAQRSRSRSRRPDAPASDEEQVNEGMEAMAVAKDLLSSPPKKKHRRVRYVEEPVEVEIEPVDHADAPLVTSFRLIIEATSVLLKKAEHNRLAETLTMENILPVVVEIFERYDPASVLNDSRTETFEGRHPLPATALLRNGETLSWSAVTMAWTHLQMNKDAGCEQLMQEFATNAVCGWDGAMRLTTRACIGVDHNDMPPQDMVFNFSEVTTVRTGEGAEILQTLLEHAFDFVYNVAETLGVEIETVKEFLGGTGHRELLEPKQALDMARKGKHKKCLPFTSIQLDAVTRAVDWNDALAGAVPMSDVEEEEKEA